MQKHIYSINRHSEINNLQCPLNELGSCQGIAGAHRMNESSKFSHIMICECELINKSMLIWHLFYRLMDFICNHKIETIFFYFHRTFIIISQTFWSLWLRSIHSSNIYDYQPNFLLHLSTLLPRDFERIKTKSEKLIKIIA